VLGLVLGSNTLSINCLGHELIKGIPLGSRT
jgi:hypothetical protein